MPGTHQKSYSEDLYNKRRGYESPNENRHYSYPDSPSAFSQLTTATRRDEEHGEDDPNAPVVIRIVAPANLRAGYTIDVLYEDKPYTVEIPRGGVREGEEFETVIDPRQTYNYESSRGSRMEHRAEEEEDSRIERYSQEQRSERSANSRNTYEERSRHNANTRHSPEERSQRSANSKYSMDEQSRRSANSKYSVDEQSRRSANTGGNHRQQHMARIYDNGSEFTVEESKRQNEKSNDIKQTSTYRTEADDENKDEKTEDTIWYDENGTPMGGWRTRLCSCFDVITQSTFWMGCFCAPVLMAQLITRLKLTWNGREGPPEETFLSFNRIVLSLVFTMSVFWVPILGSVVLFVYYLVVIVKIGSAVRGYMRQKYKIPSTLPTRCGDRCDDVCMMLFCGCCSSIQMARHTHDDKDYPGHGCTTTGLEFDAPAIV